MRVYLDNAATTPLTDEVKEYVVSLLDQYQNPSSAYRSGAKVRGIIDNARRNVAKFIGGDERGILFTSSGSAANTLAVIGTVKNSQYHVYCSPTVHKSMLNACQSIPGCTMLHAREDGMLDLMHLEMVLQSDGGRPLVCLEWANSEIGSVNDIHVIAETVHKYGGVLVVDATGYIPYLPVDMSESVDGADILTFSGHKLHALKGVGVLYHRKGLRPAPLIYGSQESGVFGGTENVIGIASLGKAVENYNYTGIEALARKREWLYQTLLSSVGDCYIVGKEYYRLPGNLYMCFRGVEGEVLMYLLDAEGVEVSTGSACTSGDLGASPTLLAINMPERDIHSCIRITLSGNETDEELGYAADKIIECVSMLRKVVGQ